MSKKPQGALAPEVAASSIPVETSSDPTINFLQVIDPNSPKPENDQVTSSGPGFQARIQTADIASMPGGLNYVPNAGLPEGINGTYIGDFPPTTGGYTPDMYPTYPLGTQPWQNPHIPYVPPLVNGSLTWTSPPQYWGVQEKQNKEKGGPKFWVVNPETLAVLPATAKFIARTETEPEAQRICDLLNEKETAWYIQEGSGPGTVEYRAINSRYRAVHGPGPTPTTRIVAQVQTQNDARFLQKLLNASVEKPQVAPVKTCTCGPQEGCSQCPPPPDGSELVPEDIRKMYCSCGRLGTCAHCRGINWNDCRIWSSAYSEMHEILKRIEGRVLTIMDACISPTNNEAQNKAIKDLIKQAYSDTISKAWQRFRSQGAAVGVFGRNSKAKDGLE